MKIIIASLLIILTSAVTWNPPEYKQCDPTWADITLGHGPNTICTAGCLLTSASMMLAGDNLNFNPESLNSWLLARGGFEGDLYVWATINSLGYTFEGQTANTTLLMQNLDNGWRVILNVLQGSHWVLATGYSASGQYFTVHDPYFNTTTYAFSGIVGAGVYQDHISGATRESGFLDY